MLRKEPGNDPGKCLFVKKIKLVQTSCAPVFESQKGPCGLTGRD